MSQSFGSRSYVRELLIVLAILMGIRWLVVPIFTWQEQQLLQKQLLEKRVSRVTELLLNDSNYEGLFAAADVAADNAKAKLFEVADEASFKLEQQVLIERIIKSHDVTVSNFGWNPEIVKDDFGVRIFPAVIRLEGGSYKIMMAMLEIEALEKAVLLGDFELRIFNQASDTMGRANGRIVIQFMTHYDGVEL